MTIAISYPNLNSIHSTTNRISLSLFTLIKLSKASSPQKKKRTFYSITPKKYKDKCIILHP